MEPILSLPLLLPAILYGRAADPERSDSAKSPKRLKRSESFLGIRFDFHAGDDCTEIGRNTTRDMVENILRRVKPSPNTRSGHGSGLVNTSGPHEDASVYTVGEVDPVGLLEVTLSLKERPTRITLEPVGGRLPFRFRGARQASGSSSSIFTRVWRLNLESVEWRYRRRNPLGSGRRAGHHPAWSVQQNARCPGLA